MTTLGRYQITGELGRGAMGVVYRAYDPSLDREVALKELVLPPGLPPSAWEEALDRFYTEARAAGRLSHPSIVTVHEVGEDQGRAFIAMELLDGPTLGEVLSEVGALPPDQAEGVLHQVAEALAAAHAQGVVHRDIKPDNCFWLSDGRIKVADFGIARVGAASRLTQAGTVLGTPGYMAPEQVRGQEATPAADVFSWGAMAYECLAGTPPFGEEDPTAVLYRIVHEDPPDLAELAPDAPNALRGVIARSLAKNPGERFSDAADLLAGLRGEAMPPRLQRQVSVPVQSRASSVPPWGHVRGMPVGYPGQPERKSRVLGRLVPIFIGILVVGGVATVALGLTGMFGGSDEPESLPLAEAPTVESFPSPTEAPEKPERSPRPKPTRTPRLKPGFESLGDWIVILGSHPTESAAQQDVGYERSNGADPGVLRSGDFASLRAGYWVVYEGGYRNSGAAVGRCHSLGYYSASYCYGALLTQNPADVASRAYP